MNNRFKRILTVCLAIGLARALPAQLPPENQLPNEPVKPSELPPEKSLPGEIASPPQVAKPLPGEAELPDRNSDVASVDDVIPSGGDRPILRLDYRAHTGMIRSIQMTGDGKYLVSAGDDKDIHVWRRDPKNVKRWFHHRTVRWQVGRGPRGRIYSMSSQGNHVAVAGHGAMAMTGEIWVVDAPSGKLVRPLVNVDEGHRQVVQSVAWAPNGVKAVASCDLDGQLMLWTEDDQTGLWSGKALQENDIRQFGNEVGTQLQSYRRTSPVTFRGGGEIVRPKFVRFQDTDGVTFAIWTLQRIDTLSGKTTDLEDVEFSNVITLLHATDDGKYLIAGDITGNVTLWRFDGRGDVVSKESVAPGAIALTCSFDESNDRMYLGTERLNGRSIARLQCWDIRQAASYVGEVLPTNRVTSCRWIPESKQLVAAIGNQLQFFETDVSGKIQASPAQVISAPTGEVADVQFSDSSNGFKIRIRRQPTSAGVDAPAEVFDLSGVSLLDPDSVNESWLADQRLAENWTIKQERVDGAPRYRTFRNGVPDRLLPIDASRHGAIWSWATIDGGDKGSALVVGTRGRNNIYVFRLDEPGPLKVLRQFRGQEAPIRSVQASRDSRYLVSGSSDTTVCVWCLEGLFDVPRMVNRWGIDLEEAEGQLTVSEAREDGPLYFRGVREGDRLAGISWLDASQQLREVADADGIRDALETLPFDTIVTFRFARFGRPRKEINNFPAWRPLATLSVDQDREWAFWTPSGYYDASFNGHQRFGWQINRGLQLLPDYFRAAQFRASLERPDAMRRLLQAGSLPAAMRTTLGRAEPPPEDRAIVNQYRTKPRITVVSPSTDQTLRGDEVDVVAKIETTVGTQLVAPKAFVSGVPAVSRERLQRALDPTQGTMVQTYRWTFRVPRDRMLDFEILASTDAESVERVTFSLAHEPQAAARKPNLHLLALGVSSYQDPQIQSLDFAASATTAVSKALKQFSGASYNVSAEQLVDQDATRPLWRIYAEEAARRLADTVSPDDLVVIYLCGHGLRDRRTNQWYFVTADADYRDLMNDQYQDCLSFDDLALLADLPCRKIAIIDSCHSGAVQPVMRDDDLKSVLRRLQTDLVMTLTASEGDEEAAEVIESGLGRFTTRMLQGLEGAADQDGDQKVMLRELVEYVANTVSADSREEGLSQHPTASPAYLIESVELELASFGE